MNARNAVIALALVAAALSAGCESAGALKGVQIGGVDVGQLAENVGGLREIKEPEEIEMGKGVAETLLGASPLAG